MKRIGTVAFILLAAFIYGGNVFAGSEGNSNTFFGTNAGTGTAGDDDEDTFVGFDAGAINNVGRANTFIGYRAGRNNTEGSANSFLGSNAGVSNTTGSNNTFLGLAAGSGNTTGHDNTFIGVLAGQFNTTGSNNTFLGNLAGSSNTTGHENIFLGGGAGSSNTTGSENIFLGGGAGSSNTTGSENIFLGSGAGSSNTTGSENTFLGIGAGSSNTTGPANTFLGYNAGTNNRTGQANTFLGYAAGISNTTGHDNTFLGNAAGADNTLGQANTFLGYAAGTNNRTGHDNTFLGHTAGLRNTTGNFNVFLGSAAGLNELGSNKLYIDNTQTASPLIYGDFATNSLTFNGSVNITGNLTKASGGFVQPHPFDPAKEVVYAFFEGPEHAVFLRGRAKLVQGRAAIETPAHFRLVAGKDEDITVQFTPRYTDTFGLSAAEVTREKIEVRELKGGTNTYEFDYFITAKRRGFEGHQPVQTNTHFTADMKTAADFEGAYARTDDLTITAIRDLLVSNGTLTKEGRLNKEMAAKLGWTVKEVEPVRQQP
jgi:hypothetical protein